MSDEPIPKDIYNAISWAMLGNVYEDQSLGIEAFIHDLAERGFKIVKIES